MSSSNDEEFESWLKKELSCSFPDADIDIFGPYILGLLQDDEENQDHQTLSDGIEDFLGGICDQAEKVQSVRRRIVERWRNSAAETLSGNEKDSSLAESMEKKLDLGAALTSIAESKTAAYAASRATSGNAKDTPDKSVKEAILASYAGKVEESSDEDEDRPGGDGGLATGGANANAEAVARAEADKREKSRMAAAAKKEKDKEDREKQKKQAEERKKKAQEKAAKGERRR